MIYVDACILIYAAEDQGAKGEAARRALASAQSPVGTSPLVLPECLVLPLRARNYALRDHYLKLYEQLEIIELGADAYLRAAELRADFGLKTPDALHLAAAQLAGCDELWTNDKRLATASRGLAVDVIGSV